MRKEREGSDEGKGMRKEREGSDEGKEREGSDEGKEREGSDEGKGREGSEDRTDQLFPLLGSSSGSVQVFDLSVGLMIREFNIHSSPVRYAFKAFIVTFICQNHIRYVVKWKGTLVHVHLV